MDKKYGKTVTACFVAYVVQAIINNFAPLLFLTFHSSYGIPLSQITLLVTFNFAIQLAVDLLSVGFIDRIGYRAAMVLAHALAALGLVALSVLPELLPSAFAGIFISVVIYAVGGGLLEVLVSPVVEACPTENKEKTMSLLHSFYCWGCVGVVLLSTLFFHLFGIENWRFMALLWAAVPLVNAFVFLRVPFATLIEDGEVGMRVGELLKSKTFWLLFVMMVCAGASEQAISQWSSALMEKSLGIAKTLGDLAGPMAFAILMGASRVFYSKFGDKIKLESFMIFSCVLAVGAYLGIGLFSLPALSVISCALCGLAVGMMWPGTFSKAAGVMRRGGTAMFALLALGGDLGCSLGPSAVGFISGVFNDDLRLGILAAVVFPIVLLIGVWRCRHT